MKLPGSMHLWWRLLRCRLVLSRYRGARLQRLLLDHPGRDDRESLVLARNAAQTIAAVAAAVPGSRCFDRSIVLTEVLRESGLAARLCLGVRRTAPFAAHAWVAIAGTPVNESVATVDAFARLDAGATLPSRFD